MSRISVIRNEKVVPLLPGAPTRNNVFSPWHGLIVEKHSVGAIEIPEHEHSTFCLHMQTSGPTEMEWCCDGKQERQETDRGSLIFLTPGTKDRLRWNRSSRRVVVSLDESFLLRAGEELGRKQASEFLNRWAFEDKQLHLLLSEMEREMEANWPMGALYGDLLAMSLSIALLKKYGRNASGPAGLAGPEPAKGGMPRARLKRILEHIAENSHLDLRLDDLAQVAGMSRFHFARLFRSDMGISPHQYLIGQRLQKAKALLRLDAGTVGEVAIETGFANGTSFARAFRRRVGVSPQEWKRQI